MSRPVYGNKTHTILLWVGPIFILVLCLESLFGVERKKYLRLKNHVEDNMALIQQVLQIKKNTLHKIIIKYYTVQNTKLK